VWGTNVSIARVCKRARRFLTTYTAPGADEAKYLAIIRQARGADAPCAGAAAWPCRAARPSATALTGARSWRRRAAR